MRIPILLLLALASPAARPTLVNFDPAQDAIQPSLDLDRQGRAVVAWVEKTEGIYKAYVRRWEGSGWRRLGGTLNREAAWNASYALVRVGPDNRPVVAWHEGKDGQRKVFVARWNGKAWVGL
jgi:hypothetical protein